MCVCVCVAGGGGRQQAEGVCGRPESHQTPAATFRVPTRLRATHTPMRMEEGTRRKGFLPLWNSQFRGGGGH